MRSAVAFAVAALAGSAFAAPPTPDHDQLHFGPSSDPRANSRGCLRSSSPQPLPLPLPPDFTPAPAPPPPAPPAPAPPAPPAPAPAPPAPTATEAAKAPPSSGGYIDIVIEWRAKMGLPALEIDLRLQANALTTIQHSGGAMKHELNPGTMAQVMAPGECTLEGFGGCYLGGWLCEKPQLKGLDGVCHKASKGWEYNGQTDHAEILVSTNYGKIGCSCDFNMWACDLA
ncbi:hypothetical protein PTNB85_05829 [Pyrenophora teres f. teres]|nr:hypothetical protein PTNB85_05829 [Pyrenophora teres f. teres]